jgi:membrane protease YdiL (CAAX protease family)
MSAVLAGLAWTYGGILLLLSPAGRALGPPDRLATQVRGQLALWALLAGLVAIVWLGERESLASLGLAPGGWSLPCGAALAAAQIHLVLPLRLWLLRVSRLPGFEAGIDKLVALPLWYRVWAVLGAGVVEEILFTGYGVTRLGALFGNEWLGAALAVLLFALVHWPNWGAGPVLTFVVSGVVSAAFFVLTRDLVALIVAHVIVDGMGFIVTPLRAARAAQAG